MMQQLLRRLKSNCHCETLEQVRQGNSGEGRLERCEASFAHVAAAIFSFVMFDSAG